MPGLFTGSTGAQVLSSEELSTSGPQAWLKKVNHTRKYKILKQVGAVPFILVLEGVIDRNLFGTDQFDPASDILWCGVICVCGFLVRMVSLYITGSHGPPLCCQCGEKVQFFFFKQQQLEWGKNHGS